MRHDVVRIFLEAVALASCLLLSGCGTIEESVSFHSDGSLVSQAKVQVDDKVFRLPAETEIPKKAQELLKELREDGEKKGFQVEKLDHGFKADKGYQSLSQFVEDRPKDCFWNADEHFPGVRYRKGGLYDTYSINAPILPEKDLQDWYTYDREIRNLTTWSYKDTVLKHDLQAINEVFNGSFTMELPDGALKSNADEIKADGKLLTWDLKKRMSRDEFHNEPIKVNFIIYHRPVLYTLIGMETLFLLCALAVFVLGVKKRQASPLGRYTYPIAGLMLFIAVAGGGAVKYSINHPPVLTNRDRIVSSEALASDGTKLADRIAAINAAQKNPLDKIASVLKEKSQPGELVAGSQYDEAGFLALVKKEKGTYCFVAYDAKQDVIATIDTGSAMNDPILTMKEKYRILKNSKDKTKYYSPVVFIVNIPSDNPKSADKNLGQWEKDGSHSLPFYCSFSVDEDGNVVVNKAIYSGKGLHPSHYHGKIRDERNIGLANVIMTHADSLKMDIAKREIYLPL